MPYGIAFGGNSFRGRRYMVHASCVSNTPFVGDSLFLGTLYMVQPSRVSDTPYLGWGFRRRCGGNVRLRGGRLRG